MPTPLTRDLPYLRIDGTLKFVAILGSARLARKARRAADYAIPAFYGESCRLQTRAERVRSDMARIRTVVEHDRAFWSVENVAQVELRQANREYFGHRWAELVPACPAAEHAAPEALTIARAA